MRSHKPAKEWGIQAMRTAFVYLVTGDKKYLEKTKKMLKVSADVYHQCYKDRRGVNWYSTSRVCALAAYDWIYNDLTPDERRAIIVPLLKHVDDVQPGPVGGGKLGSPTGCLSTGGEAPEAHRPIGIQ